MREDFERAYLTAHGNVALITLNHPEAMNAVSPKMLKGLTHALNHVEKSGKFRAVVMTGEGRGFCAGANLTEIPEERASADGVGSALETAYQELTAKS